MTTRHWVAKAPETWTGRVVGNGHCVALVRAATGAPATAQWRRGPHVRSNPDLPAGLAIATFGANGRYENKTDGSSHAAILLAATLEGLSVLDQWVGQRAHERLIRFRGGVGPKVNDGDQYHVIETAAPPDARLAAD